jgi:preprotein translocase subunit SecE
MENQNQKWVNLSYLAVSVLTAFIVFTLSMKPTSAYDLESRVRSIEMILRISSLVIGALLFVGLYRNEKVNQYMNEVVVELSRVTWPNQKETTSGTIVVIIMVLLSAGVLWLFDSIWSYLIQWIL